MECGQFQMKYRSDIISLFVIYCIPSTRVSQFCEELLSILENSIGSIETSYSSWTTLIYIWIDLRMAIPSSSMICSTV